MAFDPSLRATGWAIWHNGLHMTGRIETAGDVALALVRIGRNARKVCDMAEATVVAIEGYAFGVKTNTLTVMAEVTGVIKAATYQEARPLVIVPPMTWKAAMLGRLSRARKRTKQERKFYLGLASARLERKFHTTDEADAAMLAEYVTGVMAGTYERPKCAAALRVRELFGEL